ncbi:MAG: aminotransferase class V-fold PLP-dependent enzyme [Planctomycetota bacterium]
MNAWNLDPQVIHLNHGSFGACPLEILSVQTELRARMERDPMHFFLHELRPALQEAREAMAAFVHCAPGDLVFVPNATSAVNAVLRSFPFQPGDEILTHSHCYNACRNVIDYVSQRSQLPVNVVELPVPIESPDQLIAAFVERLTPATRFALLDHVTSPSAIVWPIPDLVATLESRGVRCLVDGAHAPGMLDLELASWGASFYTGNAHKWMCAPKGCGFLCTQPAHQAWLMPHVISHGWNIQVGDRSRYQAMFDWPGTIDPTPWLCLPDVIRFLESLVPGGVPELQNMNHRLAVRGANHLQQRHGLQYLCPPEMVGSMVTLRFPDRDAWHGDDRHGPTELQEEGNPTPLHPQQRWLWDAHRIQVPVFELRGVGRCLRISAHRYNGSADYERLADALDQAATERASDR